MHQLGAFRMGALAHSSNHRVVTEGDELVVEERTPTQPSFLANQARHSMRFITPAREPDRNPTRP